MNPLLLLRQGFPELRLEGLQRGRSRGVALYITILLHDKASEMDGLVGDKSEICIPFILRRLEIHRQRCAGVENAPPFFLGINGIQGAGKSTLVRKLAKLA